MRFFSRKKSKQKPLRVLAHFNSGLAFLNHERLQDAKVQFEKALELKPDFLPALYRLGWCYYHLGEKDKAFPLLKKTIEKESGRTQAHYLLGLIYYYDKNEYQEALTRFKDAQKANVDPTKTVDIHMALAATYRELGQIEKAIDEYKAALAI